MFLFMSILDIKIIIKSTILFRTRSQRFTLSLTARNACFRSSLSCTEPTINSLYSTVYE